MINVSERMEKELVVALFEVLPQHLPAGTNEKNNENIER
jgi:hypothetical protein